MSFSEQSTVQLQHPLIHQPPLAAYSQYHPAAFVGPQHLMHPPLQGTHSQEYSRPQFQKGAVETSATRVAASERQKTEAEAPPAKVSRKAGKSDKAGHGSTYASRHQAAESRRRQRINDRCAKASDTGTSVCL